MLALKSYAVHTEYMPSLPLKAGAKAVISISSNS